MLSYAIVEATLLLSIVHHSSAAAVRLSELSDLLQRRQTDDQVTCRSAKPNAEQATFTAADGAKAILDFCREHDHEKIPKFPSHLLVNVPNGEATDSSIVFDVSLKMGEECVAPQEDGALSYFNCRASLMTAMNECESFFFLFNLFIILIFLFLVLLVLFERKSHADGRNQAILALSLRSLAVVGQQTVSSIAFEPRLRVRRRTSHPPMSSLLPMRSNHPQTKSSRLPPASVLALSTSTRLLNGSLERQNRTTTTRLSDIRLMSRCMIVKRPIRSRLAAPWIQKLVMGTR